MSNLSYYCFDLETFENIFTFTGRFYGQPEVHLFELSTRKNQKTELLAHLSYLENLGVHMVGYNNLGFDYPIIHELLTNPHLFDYNKASQMCNQIINRPYGGMNPYTIRLKDRIIPQIDLIKINHFDNANRRTSLKALQFAMRSPSVEDLPFPIRALNSEEMDILIKYNLHDVTETESFLTHNIHLIEMRKELLDNGVLHGDVLNFSDVKIGTEYLVSKIGRSKCYVSGSKPKQSIRDRVIFKNIILPKIKFKTDEFNEVLKWFNEQTYNVGGDNDIHYTRNLGDVDFVFGVGGVHASVESKVFRSDSDYVILDIDVSGMYPAVAISNKFAPEHLGNDFLIAYEQLQVDRRQYPKGTSMNKVLKLAGNGAFGQANNPYSCFFDPKFLYSITVNGQLQLLQLAEMLSLIPKLQIIQANTDGITVRMPRKLRYLFDFWNRAWEQETGLRLEEVEYKAMWIRDVNNYLAQTLDGKVKRKGAYAYPETWADYEGYWNKDYSNMITPKVTEQVLVNGHKVKDILTISTNPFDFMLRYKTPGSAKVFIGGQECSKTVRYYVSTTGSPMEKVASPKGPIGSYKRKNSLKTSYYDKILSEIPEGTWDERIHTKNKSKYQIVTTRIQTGWLVKECNVATKFNWDDVDYKYYEEEINKLYIGDKNEGN